MSWGYWGIVTGLVVLLVAFFVSMEILYSATKKSVDEATDSPAGNGEDAAGKTGKKHAA
jgi:archaellum component FlaF (FlaF/FlaG flagellin family)